MSPRILAFIENNIGMTLLLSSRLRTLGYQITILSALGAFRERVEADSFDWIILDDAALPTVRQQFLEHLKRHRKGARIVWCGTSPHRTSVPIEATFAKPLRYNDIERFFSHWASPAPRSTASPEDALSSQKEGGPNASSNPAREDGKASAGTDEMKGTGEGDSKP